MNETRSLRTSVLLLSGGKALPWAVTALLAAGVYVLVLFVTRSIPRHVLALIKAADR